MHTIALSVVLDLLNLWTSKDNENEPYYLSATIISLINSRINRIQIPNSDSSRLPRSLDELNKWKAYELQSFALHYGVLVLKGILLYQ